MNHRVDVYCRDTVYRMVTELIISATNNPQDRLTFVYPVTLGGLTHYGVSIVFSDAEYARFKAAPPLPDMYWFEGDSRQYLENRRLNENSEGIASGGLWNISDTVSNVTAKAGVKDIIGKHIYTDGWKTRVSNFADGSDMPLYNIDLNTPGIRIINCVIHDVSGFGAWIPATAAEVYGNVVYYIGWKGPDRGHGHGLYTQNTAGTKKTIKHNIIHNCFGWGIHAYSSSGANLQDFDIIENTCFSAGSLSGIARMNILVGGDSGKANNILLSKNLTYGGALGMQFYGAGAQGVTLTNNYFPDGIDGTYTAASESGNYYGPGIDDRVYVFPNTYDPNRANLTIYNNAAANAVTVDISSLGWAGQVRARNTQDYFADVQNLTISGGSITVDMQAANRTVATPVGWTAAATTFPQFGAFVLERT